MLVGGVAAALALAFVFGAADAANACATLVGTRSARIGSARAVSFGGHLVGALVGGTAVAATIAGLVHLRGRELAAVDTAAAVATVVFTGVATRAGWPASASVALVGGLTGAALVAGGPQAVVWGGVGAGRVSGVVGASSAIVLSPALGVVMGAIVRAGVGRALRRATRQARRGVRAALWTAAGLVALSGGANDGQKAMGLVTGVLVADGAQTHATVPGWARVAVALVLASGTVLAGRRVIRTVARRVYPPRALDGLAAQLGAAAVILGAGPLGAPVSTSTVVASSVLGVGAERRHRHVRWSTVRRVALVWSITLPASAGLAALAYPLVRLLP